MAGSLPRLLPVHSIELLQDGGEAWIRVEISTDLIRRRKYGPRRLAEGEARLFSQHFDFMGNDTDSGTSVFDSSTPIGGSRKKDTWRRLAEELDQSLIGVDRSQHGGRWYVTLDDRDGLISYEAVTFIMMHHLSEMVRYRPHVAETMLRSKYGWVLTVWVNRACENFLLTMASRISGEEHRIRA